MEGDLDADDDADVNFSCTSRPDAAQRSGLRARQAWSGGPAVSSSHLRSWAVNHPVPPLHRPCACLCPSQAYSPAQRARIIDPGPGRRPPGRRFALHRASGPRLRCAAPSPGPPLRPLERGLPLLLRASTRPPRALPQPPPPSQPWPPSGVHFHPSDPSFGRSCLVSALSCVPSARPGKATRPTAAGARAAARAAVAAGAMAAACAEAPPPVWPAPEQPVAAAHAPVRASPAALCSSSRAAAGAAAEAAAGSRRRLWRPGRRLRGVRSW